MSENTIKAHVRAIVKRGHLLQRQNPRDPNRKPYQFMLDIELIQKQINSLSDEPLIDNTSYLASRVSEVDPSNIDPSEVEVSKVDQSLIPSHQTLTPDSCSPGDQLLTPIYRYRDSNYLEDKEENTSVAIATALPLPVLELSSEQVATTPPTQKTERRAKNKNPLTLAGQHILDVYQTFKGRKTNPGKATIDAANSLVSIVASDEEFREVLQDIEDDPFLNEKNIARDLDFVYRKYEKHRDVIERKKKVKQNGHNGTAPPVASNGIRNFTQERKQRESLAALAKERQNGKDTAQ